LLLWRPGAVPSTEPPPRPPAERQTARVLPGPRPSALPTGVTAAPVASGSRAKEAPPAAEGRRTSGAHSLRRPGRAPRRTVS
jgi:hypothetical protein